MRSSWAKKPHVKKKQAFLSTSMPVSGERCDVSTSWKCPEESESEGQTTPCEHRQHLCILFLSATRECRGFLKVKIALTRARRSMPRRTSSGCHACLVKRRKAFWAPTAHEHVQYALLLVALLLLLRPRLERAWRRPKPRCLLVLQFQTRRAYLFISFAATGSQQSVASQSWLDAPNERG